MGSASFNAIPATLVSCSSYTFTWTSSFEPSINVTLSIASLAGPDSGANISRILVSNTSIPTNSFTWDQVDVPLGTYRAALSIQENASSSAVYVAYSEPPFNVTEAAINGTTCLHHDSSESSRIYPSTFCV